jgi:hypothetical protein
MKVRFFPKVVALAEQGGKGLFFTLWADAERIAGYNNRMSFVAVFGTEVLILPYRDFELAFRQASFLEGGDEFCPCGSGSVHGLFLTM